MDSISPTSWLLAAFGNPTLIVIGAALLALAVVGILLAVRNVLARKSMKPIQGGRLSAVLGDKPDLAQLNALLSPQSTVSSSTVVTVEDGRQKVLVDQPVSTIVSRFLGEGGDDLLQRALQAAARNTSGKPTVFVNGKQVDVGSVDVNALVTDALSGSSGGSGSDDDITSRLHTLQKLRDDGLISESEYAGKRAAILSAL